jgi:endonuclease YncB( thermonuclease family)
VANSTRKNTRFSLPLPLFACAALLMSLTGSVRAETLTGRVVAIADGDTLTMLDSSNQQHRIRLNGIDAPEKAQPFGERSKQNLSRLAFNRPAVADCPKRDRYGRQVCLVQVDGVDVGLAQIEAGLAWWYRKYAKEQSPQDQVNYARAEEAANVARIGLWGDSQAVPPWEYRHSAASTTSTKYR